MLKINFTVFMTQAMKDIYQRQLKKFFGGAQLECDSAYPVFYDVDEFPGTRLGDRSTTDKP